jgi:hypothetical protein
MIRCTRWLYLRAVSKQHNEPHVRVFRRAEPDKAGANRQMTGNKAQATKRRQQSNTRHKQQLERVRRHMSIHLAVALFPGVKGEDRGVDSPAGARFMLTMNNPIPKSAAPAPCICI